MRVGSLISVVVAAVLLGTGCTTTGGDQVASTVYATYKVVRKIDKELGPSVTRLNETSVDLAARVEPLELEVRKLQSMTEENQVKIDQMQAKLDDMAGILARYFNLTPPTSGASSALPPGIDIGTPVYPTTPSEEVAVPGGSMSEESAAVPPTSVVSSNAVEDFKGALSSLDKGDFELSLQQFDAFLQRYSNNDLTHSAQFWKGECYRRLEKYEEAIAEFEKLRNNFPQSSKVPLALYNQASAHLMLGQADRAAGLLNELVEKYPLSPAAERAKSALRNLEAKP